MRIKSGIAWFCAMAVMLVLLTACGKETGEPTGTDSTAGGTDAGKTDPSAPEEFDYESGDRLDPTLDFGYEDFEIYTWDTQQITEWVDQQPEDGALSTVDKTLYDHLNNAEERLKLTITIHTEPGKYLQMDQFLATLENRISGGLNPDLVCQYSLTSSKGMIRGMYGDLTQTPYLDFEAPWWNESLVDGNTVNGGLYYITGDITPTVVYNMYAVIFNKDLIHAQELEMPYDMVRAGNWTLEALLEQIRGVSVNTDQDIESEGVLYGMNVQKLAVDAFQTGFGITALERNADGQWQLTRDFAGSRAADIVDSIRNMVYNNTDVFYDRNAEYAENIFANGKAIFDMDAVGMVDRVLKNEQYADMHIGVVPVPKYDAIQENYATRLAMMVSMFSITRDCPYPERSSAVLEAMASDGYRRVTPVVFEDTFGTQYADAPDDAEMYILIRDSIVYDPGYTQDALSTYSAFRGCVYANSAWTTYFDANINMYANALAEINQVGLASRPEEET